MATTLNFQYTVGWYKVWICMKPCVVYENRENSEILGIRSRAENSIASDHYPICNFPELQAVWSQDFLVPDLAIANCVLKMWKRLHKKREVRQTQD